MGLRPCQAARGVWVKADGLPDLTRFAIVEVKEQAIPSSSGTLRKEPKMLGIITGLGINLAALIGTLGWNLDWLSSWLFF